MASADRLSLLCATSIAFRRLCRTFSLSRDFQHIFNTEFASYLLWPYQRPNERAESRHSHTTIVKCKWYAHLKKNFVSSSSPWNWQRSQKNEPFDCVCAFRRSLSSRLTHIRNVWCALSGEEITHIQNIFISIFFSFILFNSFLLIYLRTANIYFKIVIDIREKKRIKNINDRTENELCAMYDFVSHFMVL